MRSRLLPRMVGCVLFTMMVAPSSALLAQGRATKDVLTGTWSGYIGRSEATPSAVKLEMKLAADGSVTGNVTGPQITPGDITNGTFNAATGALNLTVVIRGSNGMGGGTVSFDGRVANDTAAGRLTLGEQAGVFKLTKDGPATRSASPSPAARPADDVGPMVRRGFVEVSDWITRAAEMVPAEKYAYRPVATVRTFGQLVGHVVDGMHYYCGRGAGRAVEWSDATEKGVTGKAALVQALRQATTECLAAHDGGGQVPLLMQNVAHSSLHYGNMVTYLRMLGMVPPSS